MFSYLNALAATPVGADFYSFKKNQFNANRVLLHADREDGCRFAHKVSRSLIEVVTDKPVDLPILVSSVKRFCSKNITNQKYN